MLVFFGCISEDILFQTIFFSTVLSVSISIRYLGMLCVCCIASDAKLHFACSLCSKCSSLSLSEGRCIPLSNRKSPGRKMYSTASFESGFYSLLFSDVPAEIKFYQLIHFCLVGLILSKNIIHKLFWNFKEL